jgi:glycosyltransferase involved in cell wall biosynthesis
MTTIDTFNCASVRQRNNSISNENLYRISVVISNYNYGHFLEACIGSVVSQTRPADELIVVDDGSTDQSRELLRRILGPTHVILQDNAGQRGAINSGYSASTGDIVIFLDADDMLDPTALKKVESAWVTGTSKLHFPMKLIDANGRSLKRVIPRVLAHGDLSGSFSRGQIFGSPPSSGNAYARSTLEILMPLPLNSRDRHCADYFLIYGSAMLGSIVAIDEPLANYRIHSNQNTIYFGNARLDPDHATWERRGEELVLWLEERLEVTIVPPDVESDFSAQKLRFASTMLNATKYWERLNLARDAIPKLLPSITHNHSGILYKVAQVLWALFVVVAPLPLARWAAIKVCNPAAR